MRSRPVAATDPPRLGCEFQNTDLRSGPCPLERIAQPALAHHRENPQDEPNADVGDNRRRVANHPKRQAAEEPDEECRKHEGECALCLLTLQEFGGVWARERAERLCSCTGSDRRVSALDRVHGVIEPGLWRDAVRVLLASLKCQPPVSDDEPERVRTSSGSTIVHRVSRRPGRERFAVTQASRESPGFLREPRGIGLGPGGEKAFRLVHRWNPVAVSLK